MSDKLDKYEYECELLATWYIPDQDFSVRECLDLELEAISVALEQTTLLEEREEYKHWLGRLRDFMKYTVQK